MIMIKNINKIAIQKKNTIYTTIDIHKKIYRMQYNSTICVEQIIIRKKAHIISFIIIFFYLG